MPSPTRYAVLAAVVSVLVAVSLAAYPTKCYKKGERCIGAKGYPKVDYYPCCDNVKRVSVSYDWGEFCGEAPMKKPVKCAGEEGYPYFEYKSCAPGYHCVKPDSSYKYGWGMYCMPNGYHVDSKTVSKDNKTCYDDGERCIGAPGYNAVPYKPCCSGATPASKIKSDGKYDWGLYCIAPYMPEFYKPSTPKYYPVEETKKTYPVPKKCYTYGGYEVPCEYDGYWCYNKFGMKVPCYKKKCTGCDGKLIDCSKKTKCCYSAYGTPVKCPDYDPKYDYKPMPSPDYYY